jgi:hypothetical protein
MKPILIVAVSVLFLSGLSTAKPARAEKPETVMVTFHAKPGAETQLARVIADHWKTASDLKLVTSSPHLTLRGTEEGNKTYFVEVFTWRDSAIPDSAPPAIQKIWAQMNSLVESRGSHPGLAFEEVAVVR